MPLRNLSLVTVEPVAMLAQPPAQQNRTCADAKSSPARGATRPARGDELLAAAGTIPAHTTSGGGSQGGPLKNKNRS
jgi:hypothetical protein